MTQPVVPPPATVPTFTNPALLAWFQSMDACIPALGCMATATNFQAGYSSIPRSDWLIWINIRPLPTMAAVETMIAALATYMSPDILSAVSSYATETTTYTTALALVAQATADQSSVTLQQLHQ